MSAIVASEPARTEGVGWWAEVHLGSIYLAIDPAYDSLTAAVEDLLSPTQRRYWTVEFLYEDVDGFDVYLMQRD